MTSQLDSVNPATEAFLASFPPSTPDEVEAAIAAADGAQQAWRRTSFVGRAAAMRRLAAHLRGRRDEYGRLITLEMGKPIVEAVAEIEKCAWACEFYADQAAGFLGDQVVATNAS